MKGKAVGGTSGTAVKGAGHGNGSGSAHGSGKHNASEAGGGSGGSAGRGPATVPGDITSLNPSDGLFLRAEHLDAMQAYARELSLAVGTGTGTGVVYGFHVTCDDTRPALHVLPGLAISPIGQPLRSTTAAVVSLATEDLPEIGPDGFWVIELNHAEWNFGNENAYGILCEEPCAGSGSAIQPWTAEGVTVSLRADEMPGLSSIDDKDRRNWLASQYFERERRRGGPWIVPGNSPIVASIQTRDWTKGSDRPVPSGVPIGVVQEAGGLILDVWTARRDIGGPPADNTWRGRLAMRPWNVFLAQVLQFQNQLQETSKAKSVVVKKELIDPLGELTKKYLTQIQDTPAGTWRITKEFMSSYEAAEAPHVLASEVQSLEDLGIHELPPAGFLVGVMGSDLLERLELFFGQQVNLRICEVRADFVPGAVEQAQHLDRIPLGAPLDTEADVDILVPTLPADLPGLHTDKYGWVAFVRRREARCEGEPVAPDLVDVYYVTGNTGSILESFQAGQVPVEAEKKGQLRYPANSWEYPGGEVALQVPVPQESEIRILAVASRDDRRPLAALRGSLFAASLDNAINPPPVLAIVPTATMPEAIVVIQAQRLG